MWHVYILECKNERLYTGITTDVERRFKEHQNNGAKFTSYNPGVKIVHSEKYKTKSEASKREAQVKRFTRAQKLKLINTKEEV